MATKIRAQAFSRMLSWLTSRMPGVTTAYSEGEYRRLAIAFPQTEIELVVDREDRWSLAGHATSEYALPVDLGELELPESTILSRVGWELDTALRETRISDVAHARQAIALGIAIAYVVNDPSMVQAFAVYLFASSE